MASKKRPADFLNDQIPTEDPEVAYGLCWFLAKASLVNGNMRRGSALLKEAEEHRRRWQEQVSDPAGKRRRNRLN